MSDDHHHIRVLAYRVAELERLVRELNVRIRDHDGARVFPPER